MTRLKKEIGSRAMMILMMRQTGDTLEEIADKHNVTRQQIWNILRDVYRTLGEPARWYDGLSGRASNALLRAGYQTREEVVLAVRRGNLKKETGDGIGKKVTAEVEEWVKED